MRDLEAGIAARREAQQRADSAVNQAVSAITPSDPTTHERAALADFTNALRARRQAVPLGGSRPANLGGERVQAAFAEADAGAREYGRTAADQLARIDAPIDQRIAESRIASRAGNDVAMARRQADAAQFIAELRARSRRANPWLQLLATLGQTVADNYQTEDEDLLYEPIQVSPMRRNFDVVDFTGAGQSVFAQIPNRYNPASRAK